MNSSAPSSSIFVSLSHSAFVSATVSSLTAPVSTSSFVVTVSSSPISSPVSQTSTLKAALSSSQVTTSTPISSFVSQTSTLKAALSSSRVTSSTPISILVPQTGPLKAALSSSQVITSTPTSSLVSQTSTLKAALSSSQVAPSTMPTKTSTDLHASTKSVASAEALTSTTASTSNPPHPTSSSSSVRSSESSSERTAVRGTTGVAVPPPPKATSIATSAHVDGQTSSGLAKSDTQGSGTSASSTEKIVTSSDPVHATKGPTSTSTITDQPESTFSSPVGVTVTNPTNGKTSVSIPPLVTILSTSAEPDGSFVTFTHVIANPTGFSSTDQSSNGSSFFRNRGAMAGVFVVVGIAAAVLSLCTFIVFRRRRRQNRRRRWLDGLKQPIPLFGDPFQDPSDPPMRTTNIDRNGIDWGTRRRTLSDDQGLGHLNPSDGSHGLGLISSGTGGGTFGHQAHLEGPFGDARDYRQSRVGVAVTTDLEPAQSRPSLAQSSPSIYPPSLPPVDDVDSFYEQEMGTPPQRDSMITAIPQLPPPSHKRYSGQYGSAKLVQYDPLTPPPSVSSHSQSNPPSPVSDLPKAFTSIFDERAHEITQPHLNGPQDLFSRRTLLDVRPRPSRDNVGNKM